MEATMVTTVMSPIAILDKARKAVPAVNFALGVAGIAAATAIVVGFIGHTAASLVLFALIFIGMVLLFIFSTLINSRSSSNKLAGEVLVWAVMIFFVVFLAFTTTAVAAGWPCNWAQLLNLKSRCNSQVADDSETCRTAKAKRRQTEQDIATFIGDQCILATRLSTFVSSGSPQNWQRVKDQSASYITKVNDIGNTLRGQPDLFAVMSRPSYENFLQLLDDKGAIATDSQLASSSPPPASERQSLQSLADRLRTLAQKAEMEIGQISEVPIEGCLVSIRSASRSASPTNPCSQ
jgi:hypothetical protein